MNKIRHHITPEMLRDYALGLSDFASSLVIASHLSLCDDCRAELETIDILGALICLDGGENAVVNEKFEARVLEAVKAAPSLVRPKADGPFPQPLVEALGGQSPKWRRLGPGVSQCIIAKEKNSSVRLLRIDPGQPVPQHGHQGNELTLVLQGAFSDETGEFLIGDLETADETLEHQPVASGDDDCICLASTSDPLVFKSILPRLLQPIFQI